MAVVTPNDRPRSVRNRCVIEVLLVFLCCYDAFWIFSVGVVAFRRGVSQIFFFSCNKFSIRIFSLYTSITFYFMRRLRIMDAYQYAFILILLRRLHGLLMER